MTTEIHLTRIRNVSSLPTNATVAIATQLPVTVAPGDIVRIDWSVLVSSTLAVPALVSYILSDNSKVLNATSYTTVAPGSRTPVTGAAVYEADGTSASPTVMLSAWRSGAPAGETLTLNAVEMYVTVTSP